MLDDERINRVLFIDNTDHDVISQLEQIGSGAYSLTRFFVGEPTIKAIQRLMIFLGYSTASNGAYLIDGDFGRGTNRGVAQFQYENELSENVTRKILCYPCSFRTARKMISSIPDTAIDARTINRMLEATVKAIDSNEVTFGDFNDALFHLNRLERGEFLNCQQIIERYGKESKIAAEALGADLGIEIQREWILSIIKQESGGIVRPRFEQHILTRRNTKMPEENFAELRFMSTSFGLGQVMGFNFRKIGAPSAQEMFYSPVNMQVIYVTRFISAKPAIISKRDPNSDDFRIMARYYNGPGYESHHYHESLETWFKEFRMLL